MKIHFLSLRAILGLFLGIILCSQPVQAQELNFAIKVVPPPTTRVADPKTFASLEAALKELVNNTKWTDDVFEQNERLTGSISINIKQDVSVASFIATLTIQVQRPIFGTDQTTPLFTHLDQEVAFNYEPLQPLQFVKNTFNDNLTHTVAYYIYCILGMDYDSFAPQGGELYWQTAQDLYNLVPAGLKAEWQGKDLGNRNRYWFVENVLSPRLKGYRQAIYEYHRLGLDYASKDMTRCKTMLLQALERLEEAQQSYPNTLMLRSFANTKGDELIDIMKGGTPEQRQKLVSILLKIDPANTTKYNQLMK